MDTVGGSCYSLNILENKQAIIEERKKDERLNEILESNCSLSYYDSRSIKSLLPQMLASSIAALFHVVVGISLAYSAILLPQLNQEDSDIKITKDEGSWIASVITITIPVSGMTCGFLMDSIGRLNTVKLAMVPAVIGWVMIALTKSVSLMIVGRIILGFAAAWGTSPAMVYITEIARADMRGSMISFAPAFTSLGIVLAYLEGWLLSWRTVAWTCNAYAIVPFFLLFFIPESPAWLVSRGREDQAMKSLNWFSKYQPHLGSNGQTFAELQLASLIQEQEEKRRLMAKKGLKARLKEFIRPTGYKPLLILLGLFVFQQLSGIYITLFYSINFFEEIGTNLDPYITSILIGGVRFIMSIGNTYMLKTFGRRTLILYGSAVQAVCMFVSGLFTYWILEGTTTLTWVPIAAILLYVVTSMIGLLSIPWTMTAELFPIEIRGVAHSIVYSSAYLSMFVAIQNYNHLKDAFGGVAGLQWFFAVVSLAGLLYAYVLLPETHGVKLGDIQDYFRYNSVFIGGVRKKTDVLGNASSKVGQTNNHHNHHQHVDQSRKLMNNNEMTA